MLRYNTEKDGHKKSGGRVNANLYCSGVCLQPKRNKTTGENGMASKFNCQQS